MCGVVIPNNKHWVIAVTSIYGVGRSLALQIAKKLNIDPQIKVCNLEKSQIKSISDFLDDNCLVEGDLRREVSSSIDRLKSIGCYRGIRHRRRLPVRGQRTHSNARTRKGKAVPIAGKKK